MKRIPLYAMAHGRSGDKGDSSNVGILAYDRRGYEILRAKLTPEAVKEHFRELVQGDVERYDVPNLLGLNFILHGSLGGGGSASLRNDAQGKTHAMALLRMTMEVPDDYDPKPAGGRPPLVAHSELMEGE